MKLIYIPVSIVSGLIAGFISKKAFEGVWRLVDEEEPPDAQHRDISTPKLVAALAIEGAIFGVVRGVVDHGARRSFANATGTWPGEEAPESDEEV